jgi:hypothetical protein
MNALKNGSRLRTEAFAGRLVVGELPTKMIAVKREALAYRRGLEAIVVKVKGQIGLTDAHLIDTASGATMQAGVCRWLLRNRFKELTVADIRGCTGDIVKAKERRDAAVKAMNLDIDLKANMMEALYGDVSVTDADEE